METVTLQRYGTGARAFHWLTAVLVLVAFLISAGGPESRVYSPERAQQLLNHESLGLAVFVLTVLRLVWRAFDRQPEPQAMARWMVLAGQIVHWVLFALLILVPATAIAGAWLEGHPVTVYGFGALGPWLGLSHGTGAWLTELHSWLGDALIWLAGLHASAALFHHVFLRDGVLAAMLPGVSPPGR